MAPCSIVSKYKHAVHDPILAYNITCTIATIYTSQKLNLLNKYFTIMFYSPVCNEVGNQDSKRPYLM